MTKEHFEMTLILSILPSCADKLEQFPFRQIAKMRQNEVVNAIRKQDKLYMNTGNIEIFEQQLNIQRAFLQWMDEAYKNTLES
jgi:hypothetical protein